MVICNKMGRFCQNGSIHFSLSSFLNKLQAFSINGLRVFCLRVEGIEKTSQLYKGMLDILHLNIKIFHMTI